MQPPVALMVYAPDAPQHAAFYPFAEFSPEWQALHFALSEHVPVRFMDLPQAQRLALAAQNAAEDAAEAGEPEPSDDPEPAPTSAAPESEADVVPADSLRHDPLGQLAAAAGYPDGERWWDQLVESRRDGEGLFAAVQEVMVALREDALAHEGENRLETLREAAMRETIRRAEREGFKRIAVVCGAWHVPALLDRSNAEADEARLKGLPKTKVTATWTPWTYGRLTQMSGYGAGVTSPGWYHHLWHSFRCGDDKAEGDHVLSARWLTQVARLLREQDLSASSADIIEGVRLADSLAALRGKSLAGLDELNEAAQAVFCSGRPEPMRLIEEKLIVSERLGTVPEDTPLLPLQRDLMRLQTSLRLQPNASESVLELDLRKEMHLARSHLLHRLRLLGLEWGELRSVYGKKGSFHEHWQVRWQPEFAVRLVEVAIWGNTVPLAASHYAQHQAHRAPNLPALTTLLSDTLLADLPGAVATLTRALEEKAALTSDVTHLMAALPALVQVLRYGNVRKTDLGQVAQVLGALAPRLCIGLPGACSSLDDGAANAMYKQLIQTHSAFQTLADAAYSELWVEALRRVLGREGVHGLVRGRSARLLFELGALSGAAAAQHLSLALSRASEPTEAAAWLEGFLRDSGVVLLHDATLWQVLDAWLQTLSDATFVQLVPLLRRTFSSFSAPERRQMGARVKRGVAPSRTVMVDETRAQAVMPVVRRLLGVAEVT